MNNDKNKPKETIPLNLIINKTNEIEDNEIKFKEKIEYPLNINNLNKENENENNDINKPKEITKYSGPLNINQKNQIEDDKSELKFLERGLDPLSNVRKNIKKCPI